MSELREWVKERVERCWLEGYEGDRVRRGAHCTPRELGRLKGVVLCVHVKKSCFRQ